MILLAKFFRAYFLPLGFFQSPKRTVSTHYSSSTNRLVQSLTHALGDSGHPDPTITLEFRVHQISQQRSKQFDWFYLDGRLDGRIRCRRCVCQSRHCHSSSELNTDCPRLGWHVVFCMLCKAQQRSSARTRCSLINHAYSYDVRNRRAVVLRSRDFSDTIVDNDDYP